MPDLSLQYPIGKFLAQKSYTPEETASSIAIIRVLPDKLATLLTSFTPELLDTPYRPGGWTGQQVIHHLADSHMHAYIRCKWTLTEDTPLIKAYDETTWALTPETKMNPELSVALLNALHPKWVVLLSALSSDDLQKSFMHPQTNKHVPLNRLIALYAWHGEHHLAHLHLILDCKS
ncbi:MAG: putative metal-dependent hydrolase [Cyclobacteriaceae bacterium]|nr:putative metal-dependent hydrolase [Cyclobacteriaceae bacterium]